MRGFVLFCLVVFFAILTGCGGGGGGTTPQTGDTCKAVITVQWSPLPADQKLLPLAANSIKVEVRNDKEFYVSQTLARPATGTTSSTTFGALPAGNLTFTATAYPNTNGTGVAQATGVVPKTANIGDTLTVNLTMDSTIDHLEVTPVDRVVTMGASLPLTVTAKNASEQVVLVHSSCWNWASTNTSIATVNANSGLVIPVAPGTVDITVIENESTKTLTVPVIVEAKLDGYIYFWYMQPSGTNNYNYLYRMAPNGSGRTSIYSYSLGIGTNDPVPALSPDGARLALIRSNELYVVGADGSGARRVNTGTLSNLNYPTWTPDGGSIVFVGTASSQANLYIVDADSGVAPVQLTSNANVELTPAVSPDGTRIAFTMDGQIYTMKMDGADLVKLTTLGASNFQATYSPDGSKIAFTSTRDGHGEIYVMNADGTNQTRLTTETTVATNPSWSPSGGHIAFNSNRSGQQRIHLMNADGSLPRQVGAAGVGIFDTKPCWGPRTAGAMVTIN